MANCGQGLAAMRVFWVLLGGNLGIPVFSSLFIILQPVLIAYQSVLADDNTAVLRMRNYVQFCIRHLQQSYHCHCLAPTIFNTSNYSNTFYLSWVWTAEWSNNQTSLFWMKHFLLSILSNFTYVNFGNPAFFCFVIYYDKK